MDESSSITLAFLVTIANLVLAFVSYFHGRRKDNRAEMQENEDQAVERVKSSDAMYLANKEFQIKTQVKLDQICSTTTETRTDIKAMESRQLEFDKRLSSSETAIEAIDKRLSRMEAVTLIGGKSSSE